MLTIHDDASGMLTGNGFTPNAIYLVLTSTLLRIADDKSLPLAEIERDLLKKVAPHALHHTWATDAVTRKMPLDVVQGILGHTSLNTTSIYTKADRTRKIEEVAKLFAE
jgi:site-specific recombinase XerD